MIGEVAAHASDGHVVDALAVHHHLGRLRRRHAGLRRHAGKLAERALHRALRDHAQHRRNDDQQHRVIISEMEFIRHSPKHLRCFWFNYI